MNVNPLHQRITELELAVLALAKAEFGDTPGHDFHGNQWRDVGSVAAPMKEHLSGGTVSQRGYAKVPPSKAWPSGTKPGYAAHDLYGGPISEGHATEKDAMSAVEKNAIEQGRAHWKHADLKEFKPAKESNPYYATGPAVGRLLNDW